MHLFLFSVEQGPICQWLLSSYDEERRLDMDPYQRKYCILKFVISTAIYYQHKLHCQVNLAVKFLYVNIPFLLTYSFHLIAMHFIPLDPLGPIFNCVVLMLLRN